MKKTYTITHDQSLGEIKVEIDHDFPDMEERIKQMVEFWHGYESKLEDNDGDYLKTFLNQLCRTSMRIIFVYDYTIYGLVSEFNDKEGWCPMDGSYGIKIISVVDPDFGLDEEENFSII